VSELRKIDGMEIVAPPQLTITAFRLVWEGEDLNALNRRLLERITAKKRVMLTPTTLDDGRFVIRMAIVSHRTHRDRVEMALADIRDAVAELE
jgi:aromatic-L-amino-acid decarboxylase